MANRFYNLKIGSPDVNGTVLIVNPKVTPEKRVRDYISDGALSLTLEGKGNEGLVFRLVDKEARYSSYPVTTHGFTTNIPYLSYTGKSTVMRLRADCQGYLEVVEKPSNAEVYLEEISASKAREMKRDCANWNLQRAWIYGEPLKETLQGFNP